MRRSTIHKLFICLLTFALLFGVSACSAKDAEDVLAQLSDTVGEKTEDFQKSVEGDNTLEVESVSTDRYIYGTLDDTTKKVYDEILYAVMNRESEVQIATTDTVVMERAYQAIMGDYCNLFWLKQLSYVTYTRDGEITAIEVTPEFTMTEEEQDAYQQQIDAKVDEIMASAPADGTDFDKVRYVYDTLIKTVDYVEDSENNQNIISVFINGQTVCQGYAYGTQYLLEKLGIPCTTVVGQAEGETHAWNLVQMDGEYYYLDTTWGNPQFINRDEAAYLEMDKYMDYNYFGATTADITRTHTLSTDYEWPECTATGDNYYYHENLYIDNWDPDTIGAIFAEAYYAGDASVQVKFATDDLHDQAVNYFIEENHIFDYCSGLSQIQYMESPNSTVLMILFTA